jgi:hypothetical protein
LLLEFYAMGEIPLARFLEVRRARLAVVIPVAGKVHAQAGAAEGLALDEIREAPEIAAGAENKKQAAVVVGKKVAAAEDELSEVPGLVGEPLQDMAYMAVVQDIDAFEGRIVVYPEEGVCLY